MFLFLISVLAALFISAICSLLEAALLSLTPSQVAELSHTRPRAGALWQDFKTHIERPIAVILIINTAAHTIGATVAGAKFTELYHGEGVVWFSVLFTYLMLQLTEILPKTLGVRYNRRLAPIIAFPLAVLVQLLRPVLFLIHLVNRLFEGRRGEQQQQATLEELTALAGLARLSNLIGPHQERIIRGASRLSTLTASDVMIPVDQVTFLSSSLPMTQAVEQARQDGHTRFPVCEENDCSQVLGYVNFKEMVYHLRNPPHPETSPESIRNIIRPVRFVTPEEPAPQLLRAYVDQHEHMAMVRDSEGKILGLVTLEDVIEELVGELEDEFDRLPRMIHPLSGSIWMVGGGLPISELAIRLGIDIPEPSGTTSAWLIEQFGRIPRPGEQLTFPSVIFTVRRIRRGKIFEVAARRIPQVLSGAPSLS